MSGEKLGPEAGEPKRILPRISTENFESLKPNFIENSERQRIWTRLLNEQPDFMSFTALYAQDENFDHDRHEAFKKGLLLTYEALRSQVEKENPPAGL